MAAWRYQISLLVLKRYITRSLHSKRNFVSPRGHVISSIYAIICYWLKKERWHWRHIYVNKVEKMSLGRRNLTCEFTPNRRKLFIDNVRNM